MSRASIEVLELIKELREKRANDLIMNFEERHSWTPDWNYKLIRCNKTKEEIKEITWQSLKNTLLK